MFQFLKEKTLKLSIISLPLKVAFTIAIFVTLNYKDNGSDPA